MVSKMIPLGLLSTMMLTGCMTSANQQNRWAFTCPDGYIFTAKYPADSGSVVIEDEAGKLKLKRARSASGAFYTDGSTVFWSKGVMARVETGAANDRVVHEDCQGVSD